MTAPAFMRKQAILGGTFNPVHWGHLLMAETALDQFALDQVIWVPARRPLHKSSIDLANFEKRLEMVKLAIASHPRFVLSTIEQNPSSLSYAIDIFLDLQAVHPDTHWYWIIGFDAFQTLPRWYRRQELAERCTWLVAPRWDSESGNRGMADCQQIAEKMAAEAIEIQWQLLEMPLVGLSSGLIRRYCRDRRSIRYLVPDPVRRYILEQKLYQNPEPRQPT
ncbi:MAG TPA: nicotinate (nicotinamide) nucleotide adenylyltransferase [Coleofasciculaceae cyanobacterium]